MYTIITQAKECFDSLASFRRKRERCIDYTYGRQWNDLIEVGGRTVTEYEYIMSEGNVPLKNNLIRRIVRNVLGVFRERLPKILSDIYSGPLKSVAETNSLEELFCRSMEEFLISGLVVHRKRLMNIDGSPVVSTEIVSPASFFFNTDSRDVRGNDLDLVGQVHKVNFREWCRAFVTDPESYRRAAALFSQTSGYLKVTEIWRKEVVPRVIIHDPGAGYVVSLTEQEARHARYAGLPRKWMLREIWRFYFLSDDGKILLEGDSPYRHGGHPYVMKAYPFLDGEIQSFVGDMIDQQRYTNRLITLYDWVIRASAKGVLLIPEGAVDPGNLRNVADQWSRFNGVITYKVKPENPEPKQISGNMSNLGISELLEIQLKMMEDVSGVNGILQGNTSGGNVSGALYDSQTTNAMYSLSDLLETYKSFILASSRLDTSLTIKKDPS